MRVELNQGPRVRVRQRPVLQRDGPSPEGEPIDGDIERPLGRARGADEIGEVEVAGREAHDAHGGAVHHELADPQLAAQQGGQVQAEVELLDVGERRCPVELGEPKPADADVEMTAASDLPEDGRLGQITNARDSLATRLQP
jgi:hypothetical protein